MRSLQSIDLPGGCAVTLHRTLRIPDDGGDYPLPPSLGPFDAYALEANELTVPMHRAEALWLEFSAPYWRPHALKVGAGSIDAISGAEFDDSTLAAARQDYVVIPDQPWLDGINCGDGFIRQFVAVPLGEGVTVESQLSEREEQGGLTLSLFAPRPGHFPDSPPPADERFMTMACAAPMGLGAGGRMRQEIYADDYGIGTWEPRPCATVRVDLVDAVAFEAVTGVRVPTPVNTGTYTQHGLPWFDLMDPLRRDIPAAERLARIRSVSDLEDRRDEPLPIPEQQVIRLLRLRELATSEHA